MTWALLLLACLSAAIAVLEVSLFGYLGQLVDWFATRSREDFLQQEMDNLIWMGAVLLVILPLIVLLHSLISYQTLMGNYPMKIRWQAHSYLIRQSLGFFQNEFAGRVATKVMQTALSVREAVMKTLDILVYVGVYFLSIIVLVFSMDWRLAIPLMVWFVLYVVILKFLLPKLKQVSQQQADARSLMTGRIVDSYTNITTVKLFSHTSRESEYARQGMNGFLQTVYPQMRLVTVLNSLVWMSNGILVFSMAAVGIYLWLQQSVSAGDIAIAVSLSLRLNGMSQWIMWEVYLSTLKCKCYTFTTSSFALIHWQTRWRCLMINKPKTLN